MPAINEYLVSLGVEVDERGIQKMQRALISSKATVMGIAGALAAFTVGIVKTSQNLTEQTQKFEDMAKAGKKSADAIAKQEIALKAMGKTLKEVNKDKTLEKTYKDLKAIGEEIGLPKAGVGRYQVRELMTEIDRMKVTASYAMQWINNEFLNKMARPMAELRKSLEDLRKRMVLNLPKISATVGNFLSWFMRLMAAGVKGVVDLGDFIGKLPDAVKQAMGAFAGMWVMMKASPIFWLMAGLTSLLLLLEDYQTFKEHGAEHSAFPGIWGAEPGELGDNIFGAIDTALGNLDEKIEKFADIGKDIAEKVLSGILGYDFAESGTNVGGFVNKIFEKLSAVVTTDGGLEFAKSIKDSVHELIKGIATWIFAFMNTVSFENIGGENGIGGFINTLLQYVLGFVDKGFEKGGSLEKAGLAVESIVKAIGRTVISTLGTIKWDELLNGSATTISNMFTGLFEAVFGRPEIRDAHGNVEQQASEGIAGVGLDMIEGIFNAIGKAADGVDWSKMGKTIGTMFGKIFKGISGFFKGQAEKDSNVFTGLMDAGIAIVGGLLEAINAAMAAISPEDVANAIGDFLTALFDMMNKALTDESGNTTSIGLQIGKTIGDAIVFTGDILLKLAEQLIALFGKSGAGAKFVELGLTIAGQIMQGLYDGLENWVIKTLLGEEEAEKVVAYKAKAQAIRTQNTVGIDPITGNPITADRLANMSIGDPLRMDYYLNAREADPRRAKSYDDALYGLGIEYGGINPDFFRERFEPQLNSTMFDDRSAVKTFDFMVKEFKDAKEQRDWEKFDKLALAIADFQKLFKTDQKGAGEKGRSDLFDITGFSLSEDGLKVEYQMSLDGKSVEKVKTDMQSLIDQYDGKMIELVPVVGGDGKEGGEQATGGRFNRKSLVTVSETGQTEYIIPMNRPERAKGLILQMLSEMGSGARDILKSFGAGSPAVLGGIDGRLAMAGAYPMGSSSVKANSDNVVTSNPVINVYGSSDPALTGRMAYAASEQVLVRHLRGVLGQ